MGQKQSFKKEMGALQEVFVFLKEFVNREGLNDKVEFSIVLVVEELFTNMVKYNSGGGDRIDIRIDRDSGCILLQMVDFDVDPFDPSSADEVRIDAPIEERKPGGLGLHLVKSLVDKISYEYRNREMTISVVKNLEP